jgi:hypothetical protein
MGGALFVDGRNEPYAGGRKQIQRIHIGRADDAENFGDALRDQRLDKGFAGGHARHRVLPSRSALSARRERVAAPPPCQLHARAASARQLRLLSNGSGKVNLSCTEYKNSLRAKKAWAEEETNE